MNKEDLHPCLPVYDIKEKVFILDDNKKVISGIVTNICINISIDDIQTIYTVYNKIDNKQYIRSEPDTHESEYYLLWWEKEKNN